MSWAIITHIDSGVIADRPAAAVPGRHFGWWATDTKVLSISDGSAWTDIGPGGGGGAVDSVFGRTGMVVAEAGDYSASDVGADPAGSAASAQAASQPVDATLTALAGLATGADKFPYSTGTDAFSQADLTSAARSLLDDTTVAAMRATLGISAAVGGVEWTVVTKDADTSRASTTTLAADSGGSSPLTATLASGGLYEWEVDLLYVSTAGGGTPDIKLGFGEDTVARGLGSINHYYSTGETPTNATTNYCAPGTAAIGAAGTDTAIRLLLMKGWYVGTGAAAGPWWAQNTSGVNATIVKANSLMRYRRIA